MKRTPASVLCSLLALAPLIAGADLLTRRSPLVEQGNGHMKAGKAEEALAEYDKALRETPAEPGVHFNRGTALYGLNRWDEAGQAFLRATEARTPDLKASAFYNLGNAFYQAQKYEEAAQAFKKSLAYNPGDLRAKWNLELSLKKKKEEDQKKEDQKKNQDEKDKDPNQDDKNKDKQDDPKQQKGDQKQDPGQKDDKQDQKQDQQDKQDQPQDPQKQEAKQDPPQPPEPKAGEQKQPEQKQKEEKQAKSQAQPEKPDKEPPRTPNDQAEMEAILDNLERSPKELEQELARLRALNRKPPAKDW
jgi:Ca-activated chloride channel family protein